MKKLYIKDPDEVLDYRFDWAALTNGTGSTNYLASGETISTYTITVPTGITKDSDSKTDTNTSVTVWLSGGTVGEVYEIACKIVTSEGRTAERTRSIRITER